MPLLVDEMVWHLATSDRAEQVEATQAPKLEECRDQELFWQARGQSSPSLQPLEWQGPPQVMLVLYEGGPQVMLVLYEGAP